MTRPSSDFGCKLLIVVGLMIACASVVLHMALPRQYERVELIPLVFGVGLALFGAAWLDPHRAKDSASIVSELGDRVVDSVTHFRTGTERGAPVVEIVRTSAASAPGTDRETTVAVTTKAPAGPEASSPPAPDADAPLHQGE